MREAIDRILEGNFNNDIHSLDFSSPVIEVTLQPEEQYEGSFTILGRTNVFTEGTVSSTRMRMKCLVDHFTGTQEEIPYSFDAKGMVQGDEVKGEFRIVSNQGEYFIPYDVKIQTDNLNSSLGNIKNLFHFTNLAKTNWEEAVSMFFSPEFERILVGVDKQYLNTYRGLQGGEHQEQYVEEFLLEVKKKQEIEYLVEEQEIRVDNPIGTTEKQIVIKRNGWGYSNLQVQMEGEFLYAEKTQIRDEDFWGNTCHFPIYIMEDRLHFGKNYGIVRFVNPYACIEVHVVAYRQQINRKFLEMKRQRKHTLVELMQYYSAFRMKKISASRWLEETNKIIDRLMDLHPKDPSYMLLKVQLLITQERTNEAEWLMGQADELLVGRYDPTLYCYYLYLSTLLNGKEEYVDETASQVEHIFAENRDNWRIAWLLTYLSEDYTRSPSKKWMILEDQFTKGANSPVIYIEAYHLITANPTLLMHLGRFEIQVLSFAAKQDLLTTDVVEQVVYLTQKRKGYQPRIYEILCACYRVFPTDDVLQAICTVLINGNRTDKKAFDWYAKGIQKELRITRLYEYYMMSVELDEQIVIPKMVLMYFSFDSNLDVLHNSFLYAYVYRNKAIYPELFEGYREQIERFVVFQVLKGKTNKWLAYLYKNMISEGHITEESASGLATILFTYQMRFVRKNINKVILIYDRLKQAMEFPVSGQEIFLPLYGNDYRIVIEDAQGNRFCREKEYELTRLMIPDKIGTMIAPYVTNQPLFDLWYCEHGKELSAVSQENVENMKRIMNSPQIREEVQREIRLKLIHFFYDQDCMNELDDCLKEVTTDQVFRDGMTQMIRFMVVRGMYEKAYEWICVCGGEGIEAKLIVRLCTRLIAENEIPDENRMTALVYRAFLAGKYDENLLVYLCEHFQGTIKEMRDVWKAAEDFDVDTYQLSERILTQMLYTGAYVGNLMEIFKSYVEKGADSRLERAVLAQHSYDYFVRDKLIDKFILDEIQRMLKLEEELPFVCRLAYTRYYAEHKKQMDETVTANLLVFLKEQMARNLCFPFYKEFAEQITFMHKFMDKTMVEYRAKEGNRAVIHYVIEREGCDENEYIKEEMRNMYGGVCVKEFTLFFGESLQYYIMEIGDGKEQLTESGSFSRSDTDMNQSISRYNLINDIAMGRTLHDYDTMESLLFEYFDHAYLLEELFEMKS